MHAVAADQAPHFVGMVASESFGQPFRQYTLRLRKLGASLKQIDQILTPVEPADPSRVLGTGGKEPRPSRIRERFVESLFRFVVNRWIVLGDLPDLMLPAEDATRPVLGKQPDASVQAAVV